MSALRRLLLPIGITSMLISAVAFTAILSFTLGIGTVAGGTSSSQSTEITFAPSAFTGNIDDYFTFINDTGKDETKEIATLKDYLRIPLSYPRYPSRLNVGAYGKVIITLQADDTGYRGGWAVTNDDKKKGIGSIDLFGKYLSANDKTQKQYLIHETGHTIDFRNNLSKTFYAIGKLDTTCYDSDGYIKTYPTDFHTKADKDSFMWESFADSMTNTIICADGGKCGPNGIVSGEDGAISDWPKSCANTNNWMIKNVLANTLSPQITTEDIPANADTCSNYYSTNDAYTFGDNPPAGFLHIGAPNFGDPLCNLPGTTQGRDLLYQEMQTILNGATTKIASGEEIPDWMLFKIIIQHESGYDPNNFLLRSSSGNGAYGLYQMNPKAAKGERQYDVGDVNWPLQTYNAAMLNTWGCKWRYWSTSNHFPEEIANFGPSPRGYYVVDGQSREVCMPATDIHPVK